MSLAITSLKGLLSGKALTGSEVTEVDKLLKPVFFYNGFMAWARKNHMDNAKANINRSLEPLLQSYVGRVDAADDLMEAAFTLASTYNISAQSKLFYILPELFVSYSPMLGNKEHMLAIALIKEALTGKSVKPKMRAAQLISKYAEVSNLQSRKSLAGDGSEIALEVLFRSMGWNRGFEFGKDFVYKNAVTDFTVPYAKDWKAYDVLAYIAIQSSTNDRVRLANSGLHGGAKRFLCSMNGCDAASKSTLDISDSLARSLRESEIYYVVVEKERNEAIMDANLRILTYEGTKKEAAARKRLDWLLNYTINYSQLLRELLKLV